MGWIRKLAASLVGAVMAMVTLGSAPAYAILNGREDAAEGHPYMAGLVDTGAKAVFCGGTLISRKYVLTSAQCVASRQAANLAVLLGDHNTSTGVETPYAALYPVSRVVLHPNYNPTTLENNIALLELKGGVLLNNYVYPALFPIFSSSQSFANITQLKVQGWGATSPEGPVSTALRHVSLGIMTNPVCAQQATTAIRAAEFCVHASNMGICRFDQGGPVTFQDGGKTYLIGVISYSRGCTASVSSSPVVGTNVQPYLPWIRTVTKLPEGQLRHDLAEMIRDL